VKEFILLVNCNFDMMPFLLCNLPHPNGFFTFSSGRDTFLPLLHTLLRPVVLNSHARFCGAKNLAFYDLLCSHKYYKCAGLEFFFKFLNRLFLTLLRILQILHVYQANSRPVLENFLPIIYRWMHYVSGVLGNQLGLGKSAAWICCLCGIKSMR